MKHGIVLLLGTLAVFGAILWDRSKRIKEEQEAQEAEEERLRARDRVRRSYTFGR